MSDTCIFCKIMRDGLPAKQICTDDDFAAVRSRSAAAAAHLRWMPRRHRVSLQDAGPDGTGRLGRMEGSACRLAAERGYSPGPQGGFRLVAISGVRAGQHAPHLHFHIIGGPRPCHGRVAANA